MILGNKNNIASRKECIHVGIEVDKIDDFLKWLLLGLLDLKLKIEQFYSFSYGTGS